MPKLKQYPIFISHVWSRSSDYNRLTKLLSEKKRFEYRNYSVPRERRFSRMTDKQLETSLRNQIRPVQSVLIIAGMYTKHREWIQKEIKIALEMKKNIIVVSPRGSERMPKELQIFTHQVKWNTQNIVNAIRIPELNHPNALNDFTRLCSENVSQTRGEWQNEITKNPDFSALQEWLDDPDAEYAKILARRPRKIERRRGVSG